MKALHDRLILKPIPETTETSGGILIPVMGDSKIARVVAVGKGKMLDDGSYRKPEIKEGDTVLVNQFSEIQNEDGVFWVTTENEILGILDP